MGRVGIQMNVCHPRRFACICVIAATVASAGAASCGAPAGSAGAANQDGAGGGAALVGTTWLAEDIRGRGVIDTLQTTLHFETATQVNGNGGCNRYFGPVSIDGDTLSFGPLAATRMGCPPAIADQEEKFFAALGDARRFRIDDRGLLFLYAEASAPPILRFSRTP